MQMSPYTVLEPFPPQFTGHVAVRRGKSLGHPPPFLSFLQMTPREVLAAKGGRRPRGLSSQRGSFPEGITAGLNQMALTTRLTT